MKQIELELQKRLLIVEVPRLENYEFINKDSKYLKVGNEEIKLNIPTLAKIVLICKGDELTEDIAKVLVDKICWDFNLCAYKDYQSKDGCQGYVESIKSFISAIEAKQIEVGIKIDLSKSLIFEIL